MALITCKDLCVGYENKLVARDLNFDVNKGDYLCLIGENGAGKTTLIKSILGLLPILSGEIIRGDGLMAKETAYLAQQNNIQRDFPASVYEIVLSGSLNRHSFQPFYSKKDKVEAEKNMDKMGILSLKNTCYRELSGGQQQRVLLARALMASSKILFVDEPVSALDPKATEDMYALFKTLNDDGISIVMISHDIKVLDFASHILYLGKNNFFGSLDEFKNTEIYNNFLLERRGRDAGFI